MTRSLQGYTTAKQFCSHVMLIGIRYLRINTYTYICINLTGFLFYIHTVWTNIDVFLKQK